MDDIRLAQILRSFASAFYKEHATDSNDDRIAELYQDAADKLMDLVDALEGRAEA